MPAASPSTSASATATALAAPSELLITFERLALAELPDVHHELAHRLEQRPDALERLRVAAHHDRERPVLARAGRSRSRARRAAPRPAPPARRRRPASLLAPIVDMSTHSRPGGAPSSTPCSPVSTEATWSPSTTMLTTMSLAAATSAGVAQALAPCSAAQRSAFPGVCVQTASG